MRAIFILLLAVISAGLSGQSCPDYPYIKDKPAVISDWTTGTRSFTVSADVILYVMPDGWVLELKNTEEQPTLEQARSKMQKHVDAFTRKLNALGIASTEITVTSSGQERISGWKSDPKGGLIYGVTGYSISKNMLIHYTDASLYSQIISEGATENFNEVLQNYCTVGDEQEAYAELYRQAMEVLLDKQNYYASFHKAQVQPGAMPRNERYNATVPTPGTYYRPGAQATSITGYDRSVGGGYGNAAVRYTVHLDMTFTLEKKQQTSKYIIIKSE